MQPRQNIIAARPDQLPAQTKGTPSQFPQTNLNDRHNFSFTTADFRTNVILLPPCTPNSPQTNGQNYSRSLATWRCNCVAV